MTTSKDVDRIPGRARISTGPSARVGLALLRIALELKKKKHAPFDQLIDAVATTAGLDDTERRDFASTCRGLLAHLEQPHRPPPSTVEVVRISSAVAPRRANRKDGRS